MSDDNNAHVSRGQPTIRVRHGRDTDAAMLAELGARTFSDTFAKDNTPEDMHDYLATNFNSEKQTNELSNPQALFLIAEVEKVAIGYAKLEASNAPADVIGKHPIELVRLYAAKDWLGKGVGSALMQSCLDEVRQRGYDTIWLGVWERNPRAIAFYEKWGFVIFGTHSFQLGDDTQTDMLMQRPVTLPTTSTDDGISK